MAISGQRGRFRGLGGRQNLVVAGVAGYYIYVVTSCPDLGIFWLFLTKNIGGWQIWPVLEVPWPVC